jgi:hypothetical protein
MRNWTTSDPITPKQALYWFKDTIIDMEPRCKIWEQIIKLEATEEDFLKSFSDFYGGFNPDATKPEREAAIAYAIDWYKERVAAGYWTLGSKAFYTDRYLASR